VLDFIFLKNIVSISVDIVKVLSYQELIPEYVFKHIENIILLEHACFVEDIHEFHSKGEKKMISKVIKKSKINKLDENKSIVIIGKKGPTTFSVKEIIKQLCKREIVKIKILKSALKEEDTKKIAEKLENLTDSKIVELRGHTFSLYKPRN
jgi:RNA-binding protein